MIKIKSESGRCSWSKEETKDLLELMKENKIMEQLDGKTRRNKNVYLHLAREMSKKGFSKSSDQIKLKFRTLKKDYFKIKRGNSKSGSGRQTMEHYNDLNELLGNRPVSAAVGLDTTVVDTMFNDEDWIDAEMTEEFLNETFSEPDVMSTSVAMTASQQNSERVTKKKRSAIQMTLLEIAADIKDTQQSVLKLIKEENKAFMEEERRQYEKQLLETKQMMEEERKATREMLLEILKM